VQALREKHSIYAVDSGRICVASLTTANVDYVARSIAEVLVTTR
jgi:aromatic-amino-acid transaminase